MLTDAHVNRIGFVVADFARAMRFYTRMLGLTPIWQHQDGHSAGFRIGTVDLVIHENKSGSTGGGARIYISVDDISRERDALIENGVACSQIKQTDHGQVVDFADPDGNRFALIHASR